MPRYIAYAKRAVVGFGPLPTYRQAKTKTTSIRSMLFERLKQAVRQAWRQTATFILDIEANFVLNLMHEQ